MKHACSAWLGESALVSSVAPRRVRADLRDSILAPPLETPNRRISSAIRSTAPGENIVMHM